MDELDEIPEIEDNYVLAVDTIRKTDEEIDSQLRLQKNSENPLFHQIISFDKTINFHSFIILRKGINFKLKKDKFTIDSQDSTHNTHNTHNSTDSHDSVPNSVPQSDESVFEIYSETELLDDDFKVFIKVINEDNYEFRQLNLFESQNSLIFLDTDITNLSSTTSTKSTTTKSSKSKGSKVQKLSINRNLVDSILITGSYPVISYLILGVPNKRKLPKLTNCVYYGRGILDLNRHLIARESLCENVIEVSSTFSKLLKENRNVNYKTMNDFVNYLTINEEYEKIQNLKKSLNNLIETHKSDNKTSNRSDKSEKLDKSDKLDKSVKSEKSDRLIEESYNLLKNFINNDLFKEFMDYKILETVLRICFNQLTYDTENLIYKLFSLLLQDSKLLRNFLNDKLMEKQFDKVVTLLFSDKTPLEKKKSILKIILIILSDPYAISKFLESTYTFSYNSFVNNLFSSNLTPFYNTIGNDITRIGNNISLYITLSQVESCYNRIKKMELTDFTNLEKLSKLIITSIEIINSTMESNRSVESNGTVEINGTVEMISGSYEIEFVVSCIKELQFIKSISLLYKMIYYQLSELPILIIDVYKIISKTFQFIKKFLQYFYFQDLLIQLYKICSILEIIDGNMGKDLGKSVTMGKGKGKGMGTNLTVNLSINLSNEIMELLLYYRVLILISLTISQGSFDTTVDDLHNLSHEFDNFFKVFNKFLENRLVSNFILKALKSYVILIREDSPQALTNKINKNVSILLDLLCNAIVKDNFIVFCLGKRLYNFLDFYLSKFNKLQNNLVVSTFNTLKILYTIPLIDTNGIPIIDDIILYITELLQTTNTVLGIVDSDDTLGTVNTVGTVDSVNTVNTDGPVGRVNTSNSDGPVGTVGSVNTPNTANTLNPVNTVNPVGPAITPNKVDSVIEFSMLYVKESKLILNNILNMNIGMEWERAKNLGINLQYYKQWRDLNLRIVPPEKLPNHVIYGLGLLVNMGKSTETNDKFKKLTESNLLLRLWNYCLGSIMADFQTIVKAEMGSLSSLTGYSWLDNFNSFTKTIVIIINLYILSLEIISYDNSSGGINSSVNTGGVSNTGVGYHTGGGYYTDDVDIIEKEVCYINDKLLECIIMTSMTMFKLMDNNCELGMECLFRLGNLIKYWYKRFKISRNYILNQLMKYGSALPDFYTGVSFLIIAISPTIPTITITSKLDNSFNSIQFTFLNHTYQVNTRNNMMDGVGNTVNSTVNTVNSTGGSVNNTVGSVNNIKMLELDIRILIEFICVILMRSQSNDSTIMIMSSYLINYYMTSDVILYLFDQLFHNSNLNTRIRLLLVLKNTISSSNTLSNTKLSPNTSTNTSSTYSTSSNTNVRLQFRLNYKCLKYLIKLIEILNSKINLKITFQIVSDVILEIVSSFNQIWKEHRTIIHEDHFNTFLQLLYQFILYIINILNNIQNSNTKDTEGTKSTVGSEGTMGATGTVGSSTVTKDTTTEDTITNKDTINGDTITNKDMVTDVDDNIEIIMKGLLILDMILKNRFLCMNIFYSLIDKFDYKKSTDEEVQVQLNTINISNTIKYISKCIQDKLTENTLNNLVSSLYLITSLILDIRMTGTSQDIFIFHLLNLSSELPKSNIFDTLIQSTNSLLTKLTKSTESTQPTNSNKLTNSTKSTNSTKPSNTTKSNGFRSHMVVILILVRTELEKLKQEMLKEEKFTTLKSIKKSYVTTHKITNSLLFKLSNPQESSLKTLLTTCKLYNNSSLWSYITKDPLFIDITTGPIEDTRKDPMNITTEPVSDNVKDTMKNITMDHVNEEEDMDIEMDMEEYLTIENWNEFDVELSSNGLDLMSIVNNPSLLMDKNTRQKFISAVIKNKDIFNHIIKLHIDIFN